jgi:integrase
LHFHRRKVKKWATFTFTLDVEEALLGYQPFMPASKEQCLMRASRKGGELTDPGMSENAISDCLNKMGKRYGIQGLSAHDGRHSAMTRAAKSGTDSFALLDFGDWTSITTAQRYIEAAKIANERVKLD